MFLFLPQFLCWNPHPQEGRPLWGDQFQVRSWGWVPHDRAGVLRRRGADSGVFLSTVWRHSKKAVSCQPGRGPEPWVAPASTLIFNFPYSRPWERKVCGLSYPGRGILLQPPELRQWVFSVLVVYTPWHPIYDRWEKWGSTRPVQMHLHCAAVSRWASHSAAYASRHLQCIPMIG